MHYTKVFALKIGSKEEREREIKRNGFIQKRIQTDKETYRQTNRGYKTFLALQ